ncbi:MAG TPA: diaminopimelate epimerase, partial [Pseudobdellovibrionaceae bacterium]|nr:diaminopimelate epimerase [Pseudobdellovibrionaceae bacterium]
EDLHRVVRSERAKKLCAFERLASDGLIFLENKNADSGHLIWDFYNADGSGAEMCGNAARCAGAFVQEVMGTKIPFVLETTAGLVSVQRRADGRWAVEMPPVQDKPRQISLEVEGKTYQGYLVNSGVPHLVLELSPAEEPSLSVCRRLRSHADLGVAGANVTFLNGSQAKTYERGVEGFTAACGTGAVAAALVMSEGRSGRFRVTMPGGDLEVELGGPRPVLIGPAFITAKIEIPQETFE